MAEPAPERRRCWSGSTACWTQESSQPHSGTSKHIITTILNQSYSPFCTSGLQPNPCLLSLTPATGLCTSILVPATLTGIITVTASPAPHAANARGQRNKGQVTAEVFTVKWGPVGQRRQGQERGSLPGQQSGEAALFRADLIEK